MGRAFPQTYSSETGRDPGDWQSLRQDLVALLDQVDSQVGRSRPEPPPERFRDVHADVPQARQRDALREVQRQISRFEEPVQHPNPRDSLAAAIAQIRSRPAAPHARVAETGPVAQPAAPARDNGPAFDQLLSSMNALSGRLGRLESDIHAQIKSGADIKDVADQVAQLAHVVELLAGAVGETGQVKRLEGQIASLGRIISQGREIDSSTMTRRIDDIAATIGKLAELQVHYADKVENPVAGQAFRDGMHAIEEGVRNIYDRIDALERNATIRPEDLEHISAQMAQFTEAMNSSSAAPQGLVELIDSLNTRIADIESGDWLLPALRKDLTALRDSVVVSLAPRFDAIEHRMDGLSTRDDVADLGRQVGLLSERVNQRLQDSGIAQLEAQVRQLVARMDQTGEQLAGLARATADGVGTAMPDFDAMADMVAERTAAAIGRTDTGALADTISGLESRITSMLAGMRNDPVVGDLGTVEAGVGEVNQRLKRLEETLLARAAESSAAGASGPADIASIIAASEPPPMRPRDAMPRSPDLDVPLVDPAFPEPMGPVAAELAGKSPRRHHPGLDDDLSLASRFEPPAPPVVPAGFTRDAVELPPAPQPSAGFSEPSIDVEPEPVSSASTNTFIAAARRAAQRQQAPGKPVPTRDSPMGRALSRFSLGRASNDEPAAPQLKLPRLKAKPEPAPSPAPTPAAVAVDPALRSEPTKASDGQSFLSRHRKTILFAAAVVALAFLTLNLVAQRLNESAQASQEAAAPAPATPSTTGDIVLPSESPMADSLAASMPPRVIDDSGSTTGSISGISPAFTNSPMPAMPSTFSAQPSVTADTASSAAPDTQTATIDATSSIAPLVAPDTPALVAPASPTTFELPADKVGPIELRQAAANGDARAEFEVAAIFTEGRIVPQDYAQAATWYQRAAEQGFAPAEYRLGSLYENGNGVTKNLDTAMSWYEKAAEAGNRMSMHNLASLYASGQLGKQQFDLAAKWFLAAANLGLTDSQFNLGMLYARGLGVTQSLTDSYKWFGIAALTGDKDSAKARDDIARSLDATTVATLNADIAAFKPGQIDIATNFAPIGTWSKTFNPGETIAAHDIVASVQKALTRLGYDVGVPDGVAGKKTADAIKAFEASTGMSQTGLVNPRLLAVLGSQPV